MTRCRYGPIPVSRLAANGDTCTRLRNDNDNRQQRSDASPEDSLSAGATVAAMRSTTIAQADAFSAPGVVKRSVSSAVAITRMMSALFASGARSPLTVMATIPTQAKTTEIQIKELIAENIGEIPRDLRHQTRRGPHPRPQADRVPRLPMDIGARLATHTPSATQRCTDPCHQRLPSHHLTSCLSQALQSHQVRRSWTQVHKCH